MPIYEFLCPRGHRFERLCKFSESESKQQNCPKCKKNVPVERIFSAPGAPKFKGKGFHATDYPSRGRTGAILPHDVESAGVDGL